MSRSFSFVLLQPATTHTTTSLHSLALHFIRLVRLRNVGREYSLQTAAVLSNVLLRCRTFIRHSQ